LPESVARLRACTKRSVFSSLFHQAAVGPVSESQVRLQRLIPFFGNSFKPIFVGAFHQDNGRVVLEGRFTMFLFSKVFMTVWLTLALVSTILAAIGVLRPVQDGLGNLDGGRMTLVPLIGIGFFFFGILFVRGCWWLSRNDMTYLTSVIQAALSQETSNRATERPR
jgi:hypothetical protein